jgi:hypothetical protein
MESITCDWKNKKNLELNVLLHVFVVKYHSSDEIKENLNGDACRTHEGL